jgi:hypothetical protein
VAVGNSWRCRPQESPANGHITNGAGDAVGTLRSSSGKTNAVAFSAVQPHRLEVLVAASNAFVVEEQALGGVGPNGMLQGFKIACTRIGARPTGLWQQTEDRTSCYPYPSWFISAAPKGEVAAE